MAPGAVKLVLTVDVRMVKRGANGDVRETFTIHSGDFARAPIVLNAGEAADAVHTLVGAWETRLDAASQKLQGSGWTLEAVLPLKLGLMRFVQAPGRSFIKLPAWIIASLERFTTA